MLENDLLYNVKPELKTVEKLLCCYENFFFLVQFFCSQSVFYSECFLGYESYCKKLAAICIVR